MGILNVIVFRVKALECGGIEDPTLCFGEKIQIGGVLTTPSTSPPFWANLVFGAMVFPLSAIAVDFHTDLDFGELLRKKRIWKS